MPLSSVGTMSADRGLLLSRSLTERTPNDEIPDALAGPAAPRTADRRVHRTEGNTRRAAERAGADAARDHRGRTACTGGALRRHRIARARRDQSAALPVARIRPGAVRGDARPIPAVARSEPELFPRERRRGVPESRRRPDQVARQDRSQSRTSRSRKNIATTVPMRRGRRRARNSTRSRASASRTTR